MQKCLMISMSNKWGERTLKKLQPFQYNDVFLAKEHVYLATAPY